MDKNINLAFENTLTVLGDASLVLLELENVLKHLAISSNVPELMLQDVEQHVRSLRDLANALWSTHAVNHSIRFEQLGVKAAAGDAYIEMEFPYDMVTKSNLFRVFSKKVTSIPSLVNVTSAWHYLMRQVLSSFGELPFTAPLHDADITVTVLCEDRRTRDADHFWLRPIVDALVTNGMLTDDTTGHVHIDFDYGWDKANPAAIVQVGQTGATNRRPVRSDMLKPVKSR